MDISSKILDAERPLKVVSGGKQKRFSFAEMIQLAREVQDQQDKVHTVMWTDPIQSPKQKSLQFTPRKQKQQNAFRGSAKGKSRKNFRG